MRINNINNRFNSVQSQINNRQSKLYINNPNIADKTDSFKPSAKSINFGSGFNVSKDIKKLILKIDDYDTEGAKKILTKMKRYSDKMLKRVFLSYNFTNKDGRTIESIFGYALNKTPELANIMFDEHITKLDNDIDFQKIFYSMGKRPHIYDAIGHDEVLANKMLNKMHKLDNSYITERYKWKDEIDGETIIMKAIEHEKSGLARKMLNKITSLDENVYAVTDDYDLNILEILLLKDKQKIATKVVDDLIKKFPHYLLENLPTENMYKFTNEQLISIEKNPNLSLKEKTKFLMAKGALDKVFNLE